MKKRVLITGPVPLPAYQFLSRKYKVIRHSRAPLTENQLRSKARDLDALLTTLADPITESVLRAAPRLRCVANYAVGYNNIDLVAARKLGIWVTHTPDVLTEATADIAWALLLACARRLLEGEAMVREGRFKGWHPLLLRGLDLEGKTLGLFGFGRIGQATARRALGWRMRILYHQRSRVSKGVERALKARFVDFQTLLKRSDILSLHAPLTPETRYRFTQKEFEQMKANSIFINTARGALHREKDLVRALRHGPLHSAGLDVYEREPRIDGGLFKLPNAVLLPHLGSATYGTRDRMAILCAQNIDQVLSGSRPQTPVFDLM